MKDPIENKMDIPIPKRVKGETFANTETSAFSIEGVLDVKGQPYYILNFRFRTALPNWAFGTMINVTLTEEEYLKLKEAVLKVERQPGPSAIIEDIQLTN